MPLKPARTQSRSELELRRLDESIERAGLIRSVRSSRNRVYTKPPERTTQNELAVRTRTDQAPERAANGAEWLAVDRWKKLDWLWQGFSTRRGGSSRIYSYEGAAGELNLGFTAEDERSAVEANRRLLAEAVTGNAETPLVTVKQIHSSAMVVAGAGCKSGSKADGLMTDEPGILLAVLTADCIPVLVADRRRKAVAAFHAGWRGTVKRIVERGIGRMRLEYGSRPEDLVAAIGPGIGICCFAVGEEVVSEFESQFAYARDLLVAVDDTDLVKTKYPMLFLTQRAPGHSPMGPSIHLDLIEANRRQLLAAGLSPKAVSVVGGCTSCQTELFFSHRASRGRTGRMMSVIGIRPGR